MDPLTILAELVAIPGPPGQERLVRESLERHLNTLGIKHRADAKGNLLVGSDKPRIVVTAHMDEIAMIVRRILPNGDILVGPLGGLFPWKIGEGPVQILCAEPINGALSFGGIHTADKGSTVRKADATAIDWDMARILTGRPTSDLANLGVRPGTRVVVHPSRRSITQVGELVASHFLDDRADLVAWLLALEELGSVDGVLFAATTAEEVGGHGALYLLQGHRPEVCIALELGPSVDDSPVVIDDQPTVWVNDSYAAMAADDIDLVSRVGTNLSMKLQFQALSRGGSDASCAASHGLCARPFTLGLPIESSHGFEVMHPNAMAQLARLTAGLLRELQ